MIEKGLPVMRGDELILLYRLYTLTVQKENI